MYKDKDKQREANRQAQARFKAKMAAGIDEGIAMQKRLGITKGIRSEGITLPEQTDLGNTLTTTQTVGASTPEYPRVTDQEFTRLMATAGPGHIRVSKPGDADYEPQCETTKAFIGKLPSPGEFYHSGVEMGGTNG